ncbi:MAG: pseudouridine synthase [Ilyomonas sp.]
MSKKPFEKFIKKEPKGAKKKEAIRVEKKKAKEEARALGEELRKRNDEKYRLVTKENAVKKKAAKPHSDEASSFKKHDRYKKEEKLTRYKRSSPEEKRAASEKQGSSPTEEMPLNKFIAHAGVCARREAAEMVKEGKICVNGDIVYEPGYKVSAKDKVEVKGKQVFLQKNLVYILLNKPKDHLTTAKDPEGRKTVFDLIKGAAKERVYSVGRLDRNTTGVLLLTNDGELAQKLTHPSFEVKKVYEVTLDKPVVKKDLETILKGLTLEDGFVKADEISYADAKDKSVIGIQIHSGRNRIVRRIFEHLGYKVKNLDRVMFANLTKKNVDRGKWRYLNEKEIRLLKYMNQSFVRSKNA